MVNAGMSRVRSLIRAVADADGGGPLFVLAVFEPQPFILSPHLSSVFLTLRLLLDVCHVRRAYMSLWK